jgi:hypothetical protein
MADESGLSRNRRYIVCGTEKASLNKLQTTTTIMSDGNTTTPQVGAYWLEDINYSLLK